jgi:hypothetical protein
MEITNSPTLCCRSTNKDSFSTDMRGCSFIPSVSDTIRALLFLPKPPADHSLLNSAIESEET